MDGSTTTIPYPYNLPPSSYSSCDFHFHSHPVLSPLAMRRTRVRPMVELDLLDSTAGLLDRSDEDDFPATRNRYMRSGRHDYLVRQAFLRSYQFSVKESFKERIMRSIGEVNDAVREKLKKVSERTKAIIVDMRNELNEMAKTTLSEVRHELLEGRIRGRVFRLRLPVPAMVRIQCFTPRGD